MITIFAIVLFAAAFMSAENLVTVIVGAIVTYVGTNWIKGTSLQGLGALALAVIVSVIVAIVSLVVSSYFGGDGFSLTTLAHSGSQIFALATIAYKLLEADSSSTN